MLQRGIREKVFLDPLIYPVRKPRCLSALPTGLRLIEQAGDRQGRR
jgi:hypothetical protein